MAWCGVVVVVVRKGCSLMVCTTRGPRADRSTNLKEGPVEGAGLRDEHELVVKLGPALGVGVRLQLVPERQAPHFL